MSQVLVSVVVPVYNGAQYLEKTVASILVQDYENIELILVDDGSKDNSKAIITQLAAQDSRIRPFFNSNGGVAHARNFGIAQAKGGFIAFCDQDDLWLPHKLSQQMPLFSNHKVGLVYCGAITDYVLYDKQSKPGFKNKHKGQVFEQLVQLNMLTCCTAVVRKSYLHQVNGFDDDRALMGVDDWHLWLKLAMVCEFDFVAKHLAVHVFHGDNYSLNDEKMHEAEIVCLNKIEAIAATYQKNANWSLIKQQLHLRYAKSYVFSGLYNLAGDTYIRAHQTKKNIPCFLKGCFIKVVPNFVWHILQRTKRKCAT
ncbi:glycosyltransferase family 2 protein [Colwellia sp. C1TZA3]|uniref:glycosyltransferase family 2 protein n=1 Tax=Colwellia sp. C1TZA3 TaxID=2508879 RepID=UPI0011B976EA|nr:glycosyltransferase [Colwellia sp. C1TZA3]TWX67627.1 glycosyltransferase [Colwellia sp. C1TZA3]